MRAIFKEMSGFAFRRKDYLSDDEFRKFQAALMSNPHVGDGIRGTGGLRKVRVSASNRGKGKRSGSRVIYYWHLKGRQFWLFTIYGKDEMTELTENQRRLLKAALEAELAARQFEE